jgi:L-rhamnose-H+ transport protein
MEPLSGLLVVVAAGALNGAYALPMKGATRWAWENTWLVFSAVGMVVVCWPVAWCTVPNLAAVYLTAGTAVIGMVFFFVVLWGVANVLFGLGVDRVGISLVFPLSIGLSLALGSLLTLADNYPRAAQGATQ